MDIELIGLYIGVLGIVIGIIVSYYFYRKSLRVKEPSWMIRSNNLIQGFSTSIENLHILYGDRPVENLTVSRILFWNNGSETIDGEDLKTADPLRIEGCDKANILDVNVLVSNNPASQFAVVLDARRNYAYITFDYLDEKQGAVIQVVHTGKSSSDINIVGAIKGVKNLQYKFPTPKWAKFFTETTRRMRIPKRFVPLYGIVMGIIYIVLGVINYIDPDSFLSVASSTQNNSSRYSTIFFSLFTIGSGLFLTLFSIHTWRRFWVAPKGLEVFHSDFDT